MIVRNSFYLQVKKASNVENDNFTEAKKDFYLLRDCGYRGEK